MKHNFHIRLIIAIAALAFLLIGIATKSQIILYSFITVVAFAVLASLKTKLRRLANQ